MRHDAPAALPLFTYTLGLTFGTSIVHPRITMSGIVVIGVLASILLLRHSRSCLCRSGTTAARTRPPLAIAAVALAAGIGLAVHAATLRSRELRAFATFDPQRFTTIEATIDHDWAARGSSHLLRVNEFRANGVGFRQPLLVYTGFDPPLIEFSRTLRARGFLRRNDRGVFTLSIKSPLLMRYSGTLPPISPARWNRALAMRIAPLATKHPTEVALIEALALGRSERLDDDVRDSFKRGGTYHLLVFSGLQIAIAAGAIAWLLRWIHATRASDWLLLLFSLLAPLFIGPTASVSRSSIGIGLYAVSRIVKRPTSIENLWCIAALSRLLIAPADLTDPAFQLTYAGAASLLIIAKPFTGRARWFVAPVAAEIAIVPLTLAHFHQFAIGGSILTILMTPIIFAMLVIAAMACALPSPALLGVIGALHAVCGSMNEAGATTSGFFTAPPPLLQAAGLLAALAAMSVLTARRRALAIALALLMPTAGAVIRARALRSVAGAQVVALDVGQGDSILARAADRVILVDGGGRSDAVRFGETTLLPLLVDRGVRRVDVVALTHAHPDHCGGLPAVIDHLEVGSIWITPRRFTGECAETILAASIRNRTPIHLVREGDGFALPAIHATAFVAESPFRRAAENNSSLVLRLQMEARRVLLTGDVEAEAERELLGRIRRCDILKVAHHGSRSSSTPAFLDAAAPRIGVISCGRNNRFNHPHASVVDALAARRIRVWRTDLNGTVSFDLRAGRIFGRGEIDTPH